MSRVAKIVVVLVTAALFVAAKQVIPLDMRDLLDMRELIAPTATPPSILPGEMMRRPGEIPQMRARVVSFH